VFRIFRSELYPREQAERNAVMVVAVTNSRNSK
jgi:hypothetical protein